MSNKRLAKKGRHGDTHIRKVDGRKSHVTKREADMIDVYGLLGEILAKQQGAGTINPKTGLPEYHGSAVNPFKTPMGHPAHHMNLTEAVTYVGTGTAVDISGQGRGYGVNVDTDLKNIGTPDYDPSIEAGTLFDKEDEPDIANPDPNDPFIKPDADSTEYGAGSISASDFKNDDGSMKTYAEVLAVFKQKFPNANHSDIEKLVATQMPKFQKVTQEEKDFLSEQRGLDEGTAGLTKLRAEDTYGLGMSAAGRARDLTKETYGLGVSAAGRGAGAAQEAYGLSMRGAKRGLQSGLGQLQKGAGQLGAQMRGAYGGMGGGMRGAIGGQASLAKGLESTYGAYTDQQTAATGALGRAQGAYGDEMTRLAGARTRGLGAVTDEELRLGQARGYVTGEGLPEGMRGTYDLAMDRAALGETKGLYDLQKGAEGDFESQLGDFISQDQFYAKKGGRVPDKQTFLDVLNKLPDAGGS